MVLLGDAVQIIVVHGVVVKMAKTTQLLWGMVILLSTVGVTYFIAEGDKAYLCEDKSIVSLCWKLSKLNANDISTRCYFNPDATSTYKICRTGWIPFTDTTVTGDIIKTEMSLIFLLPGMFLQLPLNKVLMQLQHLFWECSLEQMVRNCILLQTRGVRRI